MHRFMMGKKRYEGYLAALLNAGLEPDAKLVREGDYTPQSGYREMRALLMSGKAIDAVECGNDQMAVGAVRALKEAGLRVPEDVAVMGLTTTFRHADRPSAFHRFRTQTGHGACGGGTAALAHCGGGECSRANGQAGNEPARTPLDRSQRHQRMGLNDW
jgi:hypothetical protein